MPFAVCELVRRHTVPRVIYLDITQETYLAVGCAGAGGMRGNRLGCCMGGAVDRSRRWTVHRCPSLFGLLLTTRTDAYIWPGLCSPGREHMCSGLAYIQAKRHCCARRCGMFEEKYAQHRGAEYAFFLGENKRAPRIAACTRENGASAWLPRTLFSARRENSASIRNIAQTTSIASRRDNVRGATCDCAFRRSVA